MPAAQVQLGPSAGLKKAPLYPFLSQPPPQKKRPTQPLPSPPSNVKFTPQSNIPAAPCTPPTVVRRRSATTSAITAWIANVHPGSPTPYSPRRSPSAFSRKSSISRRGSITSVRVASASFLNFQDTPSAASKLVITPSVKEFSTADLAVMGYTSVFVQFPPTPQSSTPQGKESKKTLKHFRSLTALKPARRARTEPVDPAPSSPMEQKSRSLVDPVAVAKNKKSKYAKFRPAPLNNDLALAQLLDGGKMDDHATQFVKLEARAAGATKVDGQLVGVGSVWRDGEGGVWRDQDEELEYVHLLAGRGSAVGEGQWVRFGSDAAASPLTDERRGSCTTQDSDLSPRYAMKVETDVHDDLVVFGNALAPRIHVKPGLSVLAIPSRNRRTAKHLRKPEFLLNAFPVPLSPTRMPKTPESPRFAVGATVCMPPKRKMRHRPAPLQLIPPSPAFKLPTNPSDPDSIRRDFLGDSFAPPPIEKSPRHIAIPVRSATAPVKCDASATKHSTFKGILRAMGGKKNAAM